MRNLAPVTLSLALVAALSGCMHGRALPPSSEAPPRARETPPPGMVEVDMLSEYDDQVWDVYSGDALVCTTPCTQWVNARQSLVMVSRDGDRLYVPWLGTEALQSRRATLLARGSCDGKNVTGIIFTTFGGMGAVVGTTLTAVGCSDLDRRGGTCTAGLITLGVSLPLTAISIWMIVDGLPSASVIPVYRTQVAKGQPPMTIAFGPNAIVGTF